MNLVSAVCGQCGAAWSNVPEDRTPLKECFLCNGSIEEMEEKMRLMVLRGRDA